MAESLLESIISSSSNLFNQNLYKTEIFFFAAKIANDIGRSYCNQRSFDKAETLVRRAIDIYKTHLGVDNITNSTICYFRNLFGLLLKQGKLEEALPIFEKIQIFQSSVNHRTC